MTALQPSYVVLGGGGFMGLNLCRRLASSGASVRAFGRRRLSPEDMAGIEWHQGDFADTDRLTSAIKACDVVFHLLHTPASSYAVFDVEADIRRNVLPTLKLLEICRKHNVRRVVFASSGSLYGLARLIPTSEIESTDPISAYGISKLTIEKCLASYHHHYGLEFRVLRIGNAFGPFQRPANSQGVIATLISCALHAEAFEIWGDGSAVRDYIYIDDIVDALVRAATHEGDLRLFNIGSGQGRSLNQVIATIERLCGVKLNVRRGAGRLVDVPISIPSIGRAIGALGWRPSTQFDDGVRQTIEWWRERRI